MSTVAGKLLDIIWLNSADNTFILIHKLDVIRFSIRFVQFTHVNAEFLEKLREPHETHVSYVTLHIRYELQYNHYEYVPIPDGFAVYNKAQTPLEHAVSSTEVIVQQRYPLVLPADADHYQLTWKQIAKPDSFTFMYQFKPIYTISNTITDQWPSSSSP